MGLMAFPFGVPAGVAGEVTRKLESSTDTVQIDSAAAFTNYGQFVTYNAATGKVQPATSASAATDLKGLLVRSAPLTTGTLASQFNQVTPNNSYPQARLTRGYANVICTVGTPVEGGKVYTRVVASGSKAVGDIEATADGSNSLAVPNCEWAVSGKDGSNISEIFVKVN